LPADTVAPGGGNSAGGAALRRPEVGGHHYVRQEWNNKAPAVDPAKVAQIRQQIGDHKEWSQDELLQVK
jgi:hypothetical protein